MSALNSRNVHTGRVVTLNIDTIRLPNGNETELEIIRHPGASAVVPLTDTVSRVPILTDENDVAGIG